jgi:hypothetical protein
MAPVDGQDPLGALSSNASEHPAASPEESPYREALSPGKSFVAGAVAALLGAVVWALVTVLTKYQIGFMALGVGLLVGWTVRKFGGGPSLGNGLLGGGMALLGCVLGNLLSGCVFIANERSEPVAGVAGAILSNPPMAFRLLVALFQPADLLFYAIAAYEGFKLASMTRRSRV